jgi:hypothetical protein
MPVTTVEYVVLGFPGSKFMGEIAPALGKLVLEDTIRVLDLVFISKTESGDVDILEFDDVEELGAFANVDGEVGGLIGLDDIEYASQGLQEGSSVALLIWEDLWASALVDALHAANGVVIEGARIPDDLIDSALSKLRLVS